MYFLNYDFLCVYAQEWDCWVIRQLNFMVTAAMKLKDSCTLEERL